MKNFSQGIGADEILAASVGAKRRKKNPGGFVFYASKTSVHCYLRFSRSSKFDSCEKYSQFTVILAILFYCFCNGYKFLN